MIVSTWLSGKGEGPRNRIVLQFGLGLIGQAISTSLLATTAAKQRHFEFSWNDRSARQEHGDALFSHVRDILGRDAEVRMDIVWSAGKGGFTGTAADFEGEQMAFEAVLDLARRLTELAPASNAGFHLISSAGGLFEGQRHVDGSHQPSPLRPYGEAKLVQESRLALLPAEMQIFIYRPSSVYGQTAAGARAGLVVALAQNAITNRTTRIFGDPGTIRDYVLVDDIARFVTEQVVEPGRPGTFFLASGKPTSIAEMIVIVQNALRKRLYLQFSPVRSNALDMSFRPASLPPGWWATDLATGVRQTIGRVTNTYLIRV